MQDVDLKRREFIALLGGAAALPLAARAQHAERAPHRRDLGRQCSARAGRPRGILARAATVGVDGGPQFRLSVGNAAETRRHVAELVALAPDVIYTTGSVATGPILEATSTVPIVFAIVPDPVGFGFVKSLSRPGDNATGFMMFEFSLCGKWPALLKEIAPHTTRAAVLRDPAVPAGIGQFAVIQSVAGSVGLEVIPVNLSDATELEREVAAFAQSANGGVILTAGALSAVHRDLIITLAARHKLPAVFQERNYADAGGLISYGPNFLNQFRQAAGYVDRILKGEKPGDLPVQAPTKYELVVNLKTAKALGLSVPPTLLARADEVIE